MGATVVFQHDSQQAIHRAAAARNELQHIIAAALVLDCALDGFDLPLDAAHAIEQRLLLANCMAHGKLEVVSPT